MCDMTDPTGLNLHIQIYIYTVKYLSVYMSVYTYRQMIIFICTYIFVNIFEYIFIHQTKKNI